MMCRLAALVQLATSKETWRAEPSAASIDVVTGLVPPVPSGTPGGPVTALTEPVCSWRFVGELRATKVTLLMSSWFLLREFVPSVGWTPAGKTIVSYTEKVIVSPPDEKKLS